MADLTQMLNPQTVAVIGASDRAHSLGKAIFENLCASGRQRVYPVNPGRKEVFAEMCYPSIAQVPEPVDLAVVAVRAELVPSIVRECGQSGVHSLLIISSGFGETGPAGKAAEAQLVELKKTFDMRIIGPNSMGIIRPHVGLNASFLKIPTEPGKVAFISQSGQVGDAILEWGREAHIGFSMFASLGSMIDVDFGDLIDFLGDDYETRSILLNLEEVIDARKFLSASRGFARNKPIIVLKPGRHGSALQRFGHQQDWAPDDDQVYEAAFRRVGIVRVKQAQDLFNAAQVLDSKYLPLGPRLAIVTNAGTVGTMAVDTLIELGGQLARLSPETEKRLAAVSPPHRERYNPIDLGGDAGSDRYITATRECLHDNGVDAILVIHTPRVRANFEDLAHGLVQLARQTAKPMIVVKMGSRTAQGGVQVLLDNNIPTYGTPEAAVQTYMYMYRYKKNLELLYETPADLPVAQAPPKHYLKTLVQRSVAEGREALTPEDSMRFLDNYGIPTVRTATVRSLEEALRFAKTIGYPLMADTVTLPHSDEGIAFTRTMTIRSDQELKTIFRNIGQQTKGEGSSADEITLRGAVERVDRRIALGASRHRDFGSYLWIGASRAEGDLPEERVVGLPPLNQTLARRVIEETRLYRVLQQCGTPLPSLVQLEEVLVGLSNLIVDFPEIVGFYLDPVALSTSDVVVLGGRILVDTDLLSRKTGFPHLVITPYPTRYVTPWHLKNGTEVILRPIRPEDEPLQRQLFLTLSEETIKERFFSPIKEMPHEMLVRFCNIDYDREIALVAETRTDQGRRIIGISRLIIGPDLKAEFAVLVHDEFQGEGLGKKLVDMLIGIAQEKGLVELHGVVLSENEKMLRLVEDLGFTTQLTAGGLRKVALRLK